MATFADLFKTCYLTGGSDVEFSGVRLHYRGADAVCRGSGATALTIGSDIYFRDGAFAPHTPAGLRVLAHEVAHVVQQHRGPVAARPVADGLAVAPAGSAEEHEAEAAADALLSGRPFAFAAPRSPAGAPGTGRRVVQQYMAWEHCMLGDLDPALLPETWNRTARSLPCGSGTTAACGTCASANCSACGAPPR